MTIERWQVALGLFRPNFDGRDVYSHAVATTRCKTIHIAGQLSFNEKGEVVGKDDMRAQVRQVGENLKAALAAAGATLDDLVQTATFVTSWERYREAIDVRHEYLGKSLPTSTTVQITALAHPDCMVEISAIAMVDA